MKQATVKWVDLLKRIFMATFPCQTMKETGFLCQRTCRWEGQGRKRAEVTEGSS